VTLAIQLMSYWAKQISDLSSRRSPTRRTGERLAKEKATLPSGYAKDFDICRRFLDQHVGRPVAGFVERSLMSFPGARSVAGARVNPLPKA
jgi:hypothetical protein